MMAGLLPKLAAAHAGIVAVSAQSNDPEARNLMAEAARLDALHDDRVRTIHGALTILAKVSKTGDEQRVPIVDQALCSSQKSVHRICQIADHLLHPLLAWVNTNPRDLDGAALEFDDEEHHVPNRAECEGLHAEEIAGA